MNSPTDKKPMPLPFPTRSQLIASIVRGRTALLVACVIGLYGCAAVGPQSITAGRSVYTEVINRTADEQILNALVRKRYDETFGMMSVTSVTANLRFSTRAGAQFGVGNSDNFAGNLVPLSAGVSYEENPTISYVPLSGEDFMRRMMSPVSAREWILMAGPVKTQGDVLDQGIRRINGLRNPLPGDEAPSAGFARFVELYEELRKADVLDVVQTSGSDSYAWGLHDYKDTHSESVREFLDLLGIKVTPDGAMIILPLREQAVGRSDSAIHVQTRSPYEVLRGFEAGIEVPANHIEAGIVEPLGSGVPGHQRFITIYSAEKPSDNATVQIRFRDHWFYIDATDTQSKQSFAVLRTFISMRLADTSSASRAPPVLTIPVN